MGRYQCNKCLREFARSDSLRRHKSSGVCKEDNTKMSDDEESVASSMEHLNSKLGKGEDIFGKYDYTNDSEDSTEDDDSTDEDETPKKKKKMKSKYRPWHKMVEKTKEYLQDTFNETVEELLTEHDNINTDDAEYLAYEKLKPKYTEQLTQYYRAFIGNSEALKKDPEHKKIIHTAKRLRDEKDYDEDESMNNAIKKRKFLFEKKLDEYDPPTYDEEEEDVPETFHNTFLKPTSQLNHKNHS